MVGISKAILAVSESPACVCSSLKLQRNKAFEQQSPLRMCCCPVSSRVPRKGGSRKAPSLGKQQPPHSFAEASFF